MKFRTERMLNRKTTVSFVAAALVLLACASVNAQNFKREKGYFYGVGNGQTAAAATEEAKYDLIANALAANRELEGTQGGKIVITADIAASFKLPKLGAFWKDKMNGGLLVVAVRMKDKDWAKLEQPRQAAVRSEIAPRVAALATESGRSVSERIVEAAGYLARLRDTGLSEVLTESGPGSALLSKSIEGLFRKLAAGITFTVDPADGFIGKETVFTAKASLGDGSPAASIAVRAEWSADGVEPSVASVTTDKDGKALIDYPAGADFADKLVKLSVTTNFAPLVAGSAVLSDMDGKSLVACAYRHFTNRQEFFASSEVKVPGGNYTVGAVARDKRAARKEAPRKATVKDFYIDVKPVTNSMYAVFLADTKSTDFPEYWENPDYNQAEQPVVGVTLEQAKAYAAWLSKRLGAAKRLPTEDEWEIAARGGKDAIYPWGDELPSDGVRANYRGNGKFGLPSPVGSFENGKNALGLYDMAGNVWQWTSTPKDPASEGGNVFVKGGSWMDGPADLRISNRRDLSPSKDEFDVGFRLVREVSND
jgi:formylglycine-generating enzyme required for sulfatase activity